jgi:hypothetical protein
MEKTLDRVNDLGDDYAQQFHREILTPFCERHNLRFWSGNGSWFFESPTGMRIEADGSTLYWARATGNASRKNTVGWGNVLTLDCSEEDLPEFFRNLRAIENLLSEDFLGGCLGYWVNDCRTDVPTKGAVPFYQQVAKVL